MKSSYKKIAIVILKIAVSISALIFVFSKIQFSQVLLLYKNIEFGWIILATLGFIISKFIAALRLNRFFESIEIQLNEIQNIKLYLLGMFYNLFLPGGIGGDGYKIYILSKNSDVKAKKIFWAILTDRLNGVLALFSLSVLLLYFIKLDFLINYRIYLWILIPLAVFFFYLFILKLAKYLSGILIKTTVLSFLVQISQLISAFFILKSLGVEDSELQYLFIFLISSIVAMLPVSIGGMGLRELTFLYGSSILFLDEERSIAISLLFYLITAFVSLWGIYFSIRTHKIGL